MGHNHSYSLVGLRANLYPLSAFEMAFRRCGCHCSSHKQLTLLKLIVLWPYRAIRTLGTICSMLNWCSFHFLGKRCKLNMGACGISFFVKFNSALAVYLCDNSWAKVPRRRDCTPLLPDLKADKLSVEPFIRTVFEQFYSTELCTTLVQIELKHILSRSSK